MQIFSCNLGREGELRDELPLPRSDPALPG